MSSAALPGILSPGSSILARGPLDLLVSMELSSRYAWQCDTGHVKIVYGMYSALFPFNHH